MVEIVDPPSRTYSKFYRAPENDQYGRDYAVVMENYAMKNGIDAKELWWNVNNCAAQHSPTSFPTMGIYACGANVAR